MQFEGMNIGFDSKRLYSNFTGLGNYSRTLVKNLQNFYPNFSYRLYTPSIRISSETDVFHKNPAFETIQPNTSFKSFWRSFSIAKEFAKDKIDLYHGLSNEIPFTTKQSGVKSVVTIHDLIFKVLPKTYPLIDRTIYDIKFKNSCRNADRIIAISESTKNDIVSYYGINRNKIDVIYQCCNPIFYEDIIIKEADETLTKYNLPSEYILYVGSVEDRKNLTGIIKSYLQLHPDHRIPIVIVGGRQAKQYSKRWQNLIRNSGLENRIIWLTDLKDNRSLRKIYQSAMALVYPSFYEGFGLPVAEALLSKTPVITSNISSMPEAGGPTSLYVDPNEPEELAQAIAKVLDNSELRNSMIEAGYKYATETFSPEKVTHQLVKCYERTLHPIE